MSNLAALELEHRLAAAEKALAERDAEILRLKKECSAQGKLIQSGVFLSNEEYKTLTSENAKLKEELGKKNG